MDYFFIDQSAIEDSRFYEKNTHLEVGFGEIKLTLNTE